MAPSLQKTLSVREQKHSRDWGCEYETMEESSGGVNRRSLHISSLKISSSFSYHYTPLFYTSVGCSAEPVSWAADADLDPRMVMNSESNDIRGLFGRLLGCGKAGGAKV